MIKQIKKKRSKKKDSERPANYGSDSPGRLFWGGNIAAEA